MRYIQRLRKEREETQKAVQEADELVRDFRVHLTLPKFHEERWISIEDVERRLMEIQNKLLEAQQ